jgi:hypothetical protein
MIECIGPVGRPARSDDIRPAGRCPAGLPLLRDIAASAAGCPNVSATGSGVGQRWLLRRRRYCEPPVPERVHRAIDIQRQVPATTVNDLLDGAVIPTSVNASTTQTSPNLGGQGAASLAVRCPFAAVATTPRPRFGLDPRCGRVWMETTLVVVSPQLGARKRLWAVPRMPTDHRLRLLRHQGRGDADGPAAHGARDGPRAASMTQRPRNERLPQTVRGPAQTRSDRPHTPQLPAAEAGRAIRAPARTQGSASP